MIRRQGQYYICQSEEQEPVAQIRAQQPRQQFEAAGNIKQRLAQIRSRIDQLKKQREDAPKSNHIKMPTVYQSSSTIQDYSINLSIPSQLLALEERIEKIEASVTANEIKRQGIDKNGTVVDRVKKLQKKLEDMIKNKSVEIIVNNINQYSDRLQAEEKQQSYRQKLYLYQVFTKTQGLNEEMNILEKYLQGLNKVQRVVNGVVPLPKLIQSHNEILSKKQELSTKITNMFSSMKAEYKKLLEEIDSIQV